MSGNEFVSGRGRHKNTAAKGLRETSWRIVKGLKNIQKALICAGRRKSYSKTDTDATFMRMKEDHMLERTAKAGV